MQKKKLYIVKKLVSAVSIEKAATARGTVYEITVAEDQNEQTAQKNPIGFQKYGNKSGKA